MQPRSAWAVEGDWIRICKNWYNWSHPISRVSFRILLATTSPTLLHALESFYKLFVTLLLFTERRNSKWCIISWLALRRSFFFHLGTVLGCWCHCPFPNRHTAITLWSIGRKTLKDSNFSHLRLLFVTTKIQSLVGLLGWLCIPGGLLRNVAFEPKESNHKRCQSRIDQNQQIRMDIAHQVVVLNCFDIGQWLMAEFLMEG